MTAACSGADGKPGASCTVADNGDGTSTLSCDDGTKVIVKDGSDGQIGLAGKDGTQGSDGADGIPGKNGKDGVPGTDGNPGTDGTSTKIAESFFCTGGLEGQPGLGFSYDAVLLSSGDLFVTGSVNNLATSASATRFYSPSQAGYVNAPVSFVFDLDNTFNSGYWVLSLERSTLVAVIEYHAADGGPVTNTWSMPATACVHNTY